MCVEQILHLTGNTDLEVKFAPKQREMLKKFLVSLKISWEPGSLVPGEYPTLCHTDIKTNLSSQFDWYLTCQLELSLAIIAKTVLFLLIV